MSNNTNREILYPIAEKIIDGIITLHKEELKHLRKLKRGEVNDLDDLITKEPKKVLREVSEHITTTKPPIDIAPSPPSDSIPPPKEPLPAKYQIYQQHKLEDLMRIPPDKPNN